MPAQVENEVEKILDNLFVFDSEFKTKILDKIKAGLDDARLNKLKKILADAVKWQAEVVTKKIKQNKDFIRKFNLQRKRIDHAIIDDRAQELRENDLKKMQTILLRIKNI